MEEKSIRMHRQGCIHAQFSMCPVSNILSLYGIKSTTGFSCRMMRKSSYHPHPPLPLVVDPAFGEEGGFGRG